MYSHGMNETFINLKKTLSLSLKLEFRVLKIKKMNKRVNIFIFLK
jgi:hypothetical protein